MKLADDAILSALRNGEDIARRSWNPCTNVSVTVKRSAPAPGAVGGPFTRCHSIPLATSQGSSTIHIEEPWSPTLSDELADDWHVVTWQEVLA